MAGAYSGAAVRNAHFAWRPPVPGVNADHTTPDPEPDLFNPVPEPAPGSRAGTIWAADPQNAGPSGQPTLAQIPVTHVYQTPPPAPSGVPYGEAQLAMQRRLMEVHGQSHYVPDGIRLYQHATEGQSNEFVVGRGSQFAGATLEGPLAALADGTNAYDQTNGMKPEVYTGDAANVGRYRLGVKTNVFGLYEQPNGKFGQDAMLHAYTGLTPALPVDKPQMTNTAPYTPNSTGTAHWAPAVPWQQPRLFGLPSESAMTDYAIANSGDFTSDFTDTKDGFY